MVGSVVPNKPFEGEKMTLLEWINSRGSSQSLEQLADSCYRSLQQMDPELLSDLRSKVVGAIEQSHNPQMKEIRGLGKSPKRSESQSLNGYICSNFTRSLALDYFYNRKMQPWGFPKLVELTMHRKNKICLWHIHIWLSEQVILGTSESVDF